MALRSGRFLGRPRKSCATGFFLATLLISPLSARAQNSVVQVNDSLLDSLRNTLANPVAASRDIAITDIAVYDAVNAASGLRYKPYDYSGGAVTGASIDAAALAAGYNSLLNLFPSQTSTLTTAYNAELAALGTGPTISAGVALGQAQASTMLASRANDGASTAATPGSATLGDPTNYYTTHPANGNSSIYQYTPNAPAGSAQNPGKPLNSGWGSVTPFTMRSSTQFLPLPGALQTPALGSTQYNADLLQVEALGGTTSTQRTAQETDQGRFWADSTGTWTPSGQWLNLSDVVAQNNNLSTLQTARLSALVGASLADAGIAAWEAKYTNNTARPITEIQESTDPAIADPTWQSIWNAPNFPSYVSGHSTYSSAAAAALEGFFGTDSMSFCISADPNAASLPNALGGTGFIDAADATECFDNFTDAAEAAGMSRLYGGIHTMTDNLAGQYLGSEIGTQAAGDFFTAVPEPAPSTLFGIGAASLALLYRRRRTVSAAVAA